MATRTVAMGQVKRLVNYTIDNNKVLEKDGETPIAISLEASAGIGKTSILKQIAEERGMGFTKINMAQLDEPGDIIGYPLKEFECQILKRTQTPDGKFTVSVLPKMVWMNEKQLGSNTDPNIKFRQTGNTRMSYAKPAWVPDYNENGNLVVLDDYVRANPSLLQACMDLVLEQKYVSWEFPKNTTICLTNNPDDGTNNVNSLDEAQRSRFMNFEVKWDANAWAAWAERAKIDGRCINFVLSYANELFEADAEGNRICNPRSFVMFARMISGIKDWDTDESLSFISMIANGCFKDEDGRFAKMFSAFLRNKMHLLIEPKEMLLNPWSKVKDTLESLLYDSTGQYRPDIASLLERRFTNYVPVWLDSDGDTPISTVKDRILNFIHNEKKGGKKIFNADLFYHMLKNITADHKRQTQKLLHEPEIANILV